MTAAIHTLKLADAAHTRALGAAIGDVVSAGDLVILTGGLGAGKTTLTQGIGAVLGVVGDVVSPTFIIARAHGAGARELPLIHVDAYRLTSLAELDQLDLDESLEAAVTVVEWGDGLAEALADSWLHVTLARPRGGDVSGDPEAGVRTARLESHGERWAAVDLAKLTAALA